MAKIIQIGHKSVVEGQSIYFIAEIGINHNGSLSEAQQLIDIAVKCGFDTVKFQKRMVDVV